MSANALRTVDHRGGLDAFLLKAKDAELAPKMLTLKRQIAKKSASRGCHQSQLIWPANFGLSAFSLDAACQVVVMAGRLSPAGAAFVLATATGPHLSTNLNCSSSVR